jgi:hypothetical protein
MAAAVVVVAVALVGWSIATTATALTIGNRIVAVVLVVFVLIVAVDMNLVVVQQ